MFKLGFRVDANNTIGTGHLIEVISIIKTLNHRIKFLPIILTTHDDYTELKLKELGESELKYLSENVSETEEIKEILSILKKERCSTLVIDLLRRSDSFYEALSDNLENTFIISDLDDCRERSAKVVVNFSITQGNNFYKQANKYKTKYLVGPKYFPLDLTIKNIRTQRLHKIVKKIFVSQGGSDPFGLTAKIIRALKTINFKGVTNVILGGAMGKKEREEIDKLMLSLEGHYNFYSNLKQTEFYKLLAQSDLAVTSPGNTIYEVAYLGIPAVIISHHGRHAKIAQTFAKRGAVIDIGVGRKINEKKIAIYLAEIIRNYYVRINLHKCLLGIVDGGGCDRVADEIINFIYKK